jgi:hypothetical protein
VGERKNPASRFSFVALIGGIEGGRLLGVSDTLQGAKNRVAEETLDSIQHFEIVRCQINSPKNYNAFDMRHGYKRWVLNDMGQWVEVSE